MKSRVEHQVCYCVIDRVTFVNGQWQGADIPESKRVQKDVQACPLVWDYLNKAGAAGWELVSVLENQQVIKGQPYVRTLYLKRVQMRD